MGSSSTVEALKRVFQVLLNYPHHLRDSVFVPVVRCHPRSYEREDMVFNPLHYLALLERKTNALDQAAPLAGWVLPEGFAQMRRLMEARLDSRPYCVAAASFHLESGNWFLHR